MPARLTRMLAGGIAAAMMTFGMAAAPAAAQDAGPGWVQLIVNQVKPGQYEAFNAWVADFRAVVDKLIADGKLTPEQTCAFRTWRVLAPVANTVADAVAADQPLAYVFMFDPVRLDVSYSLQDYLVMGLGEAEATAKLTAYQDMLAGEPFVLYGEPATPGDALDRSAVCP